MHCQNFQKGRRYNPGEFVLVIKSFVVQFFELPFQQRFLASQMSTLKCFQFVSVPIFSLLLYIYMMMNENLQEILGTLMSKACPVLGKFMREVDIKVRTFCSLVDNHEGIKRKDERMNKRKNRQ